MTTTAELKHNLLDLAHRLDALEHDLTAAISTFESGRRDAEHLFAGTNTTIGGDAEAALARGAREVRRAADAVRGAAGEARRYADSTV